VARHTIMDFADDSLESGQIDSPPGAGEVLKRKLADLTCEDAADGSEDSDGGGSARSKARNGPCNKKQFVDVYGEGVRAVTIVQAL
jgi:hypothetical protein